MGTYLTQVIASAVLAVLLWLMIGTYARACTALAFYMDSLVYVLVGMLIAYVVVAVMSSDSLILKMNETGIYKSLNDALGYAMVISLGAVILNLVFYFHFAFKAWPIVNLESVESIVFLLLLFISNLALLFFLTVITKLVQISRLRLA